MFGLDNHAPKAIAVFPVDGGPAKSIARPAIFPSCTIFKIIPAAFRAFAWPTIPCEFSRGSNLSSNPSPRICECAPYEGFRSALGCRSVQTHVLTYPLHFRYVPKLGRPCSYLCRLERAISVQQGTKNVRGRGDNLPLVI
jgi:hypothetical protein